MMEGARLQTAAIEVAAFKRVVEQLRDIALFATTMQPEHAVACAKGRENKLTNETYRGLKTVWSDRLGKVIVERTSAILTNIADSYCNESRLCYRLSREPGPRRPSTGTTCDDIDDRITHPEIARCKRPAALQRRRASPSVALPLGPSRTGARSPSEPRQASRERWRPF